MDTSTTTCFCVLCAPFGGKRLTVKTTWEHANRMFAQGFQPTDYRWLQQFVPLKSTPTRDNNEETATEIRSMGESATAFVVDVTKTDDIHKTAEQMRREVGDVDILVNNAGILYGGELLKLKEAHIRRTFEVNTLAHFWTVKEFMPAMLEKNSGHIVTIASMSAKSGTAYLVDYSASKYAAYGFTEALQEEILKLGKDGVKTTTVNPMFVSTGLVKEPKDKVYPILKPKEVALETVKGIMYDQEFVYIPRSLNISLRVAGLFPRKFQRFLKAFAEQGIQPQYDPHSKSD